MNMKKLFPEKRLTKKGLLDFLDRKGFYIILILCIVVVGATAVFVTTHNLTSSNQDYNAENFIPEEFDEEMLEILNAEPDFETPIDVASTLPENETEAAINEDLDNAGKVAQSTSEKGEPVKTGDGTAAKSDGAQLANKTVAAGAPASTAKSTSEISSTEPKTNGFIMPVIGDVTFVYAMDKLVYSKTLEEWRTHSGVDLAADRGTPVKVVGDGFVSDIKHDPRFGITIIVDHGNGVKSVYANLAGDDMVSPNQKLKQGEIIGCVGNTALFESAEQSHLHFEVLKDDEPVNPETWISIKKD